MKILWILAAVGASFATGQTGSVHDVMEAANEGKPSLYDQVVGGHAGAAEAKRLAKLYAALPRLKPGKGDAKSWQEKSTALAAAAQEVADRKPGAIERLKKAADCKGCHAVHKSEGK